MKDGIGLSLTQKETVRGAEFVEINSAEFTTPDLLAALNALCENSLQISGGRRITIDKLS